MRKFKMLLMAAVLSLAAPLMIQSAAHADVFKRACWHSGAICLGMHYTRQADGTGMYVSDLTLDCYETDWNWETMAVDGQSLQIIKNAGLSSSAVKWTAPTGGDLWDNNNDNFCEGRSIDISMSLPNAVSVDVVWQFVAQKNWLPDQSGQIDLSAENNLG